MKLSKALLIAGIAPAFLVGCAEQNATYVDAKGPRTLVTVDQINFQEFIMIAEKVTDQMIDEIINGGKLNSGVAGKPAVLSISRIVNQTGQHFDTDQLTKVVSVRLQKTGKVLTSTTIRQGGPADPMARTAQVEQAMLGNANATRSPDYYLSGKILDVQTKNDSTRQMAYIFQLTLTGSDGLGIWEGQETIVKQAKKPTIGF